MGRLRHPSKGLLKAPGRRGASSQARNAVIPPRAGLGPGARDYLHMNPAYGVACLTAFLEHHGLAKQAA
jgi:hypothetical protein